MIGWRFLYSRGGIVMAAALLKRPWGKLLGLAGLAVVALALFTETSAGDDPPPAPLQKELFDFEDAAEVQAWSNLELPGSKEPPARIRQSEKNATSGKHSLAITFAGGTWPTITTTRVPGDWM